MIQPMLIVLPMGLDWALHFCQGVVEKAVEDTVGASRLLRDREASPILQAEPPGLEDCSVRQDHPAVAAGAYVDNVAVMSSSVM